ncbi:MAG TPA: S9 family peptidase [Myxococcaceae bacterium]|nr:S9 family peptidase [Myxococcaceae bacterium]
MTPFPLVLLAAKLTAAQPRPLADDVRALVGIRTSSAPSLSPDERRVAFLSNVTGSNQVWTVSAEGGWPELVTGFDDPVTSVEWSPAGDWLAVQVAPGGGMNQQVWRMRPDGSEARRLTAGGKETNRLVGWDHAGRALVVASNQRDPSSTDLYLLGPGLDALGTPAYVGKGMNGADDVARDGRRILVNRLISRGSNDLLLYEPASRTETLLTPHEGPGNFEGRLSPDGQTVWLSSDRDRDLPAFARIRLGADGRPGPIEVVVERADAGLDGFEIDETGKHALLVWNVAGRSELGLLDLTTGRSRPVTGAPFDVVGSLSRSRDGRVWALSAAGANRPTDVWLLDGKTARLRQLTRSAHPGVALDRLVRPELVRFKAHDGLPLSGWLYRAPGQTGPGPVVLSFHGGPEGQEVPGFRPDYQVLLAQGISVFAPNIRGSAGFGKRFVNLDNGPLRVEAVKDLKDCADWVVKNGVGDPKRLGVMGGSYGGYMVMAGLTEFPGLFAAGVDLFGIVNFETFFRDTEPWMAAISTIEYGDPKTQPDLLKQLSPIHKLDKVRTPTLVLHGANDTNVPVVEAEQVVATLKKNGVPVEYVLFPDEGHGFRKLPNRIRATVETVGFFSRYLGPAAGSPATGGPAR